jgi:hypothetical protein
MLFSPSESGRNIAGFAKGAKLMKVFVTNGEREPLEDTCIYFLRIKTNMALNIRNIAEVRCRAYPNMSSKAN